MCKVALWHFLCLDVYKSMFSTCVKANSCVFVTLCSNTMCLNQSQKEVVVPVCVIVFLYYNLFLQTKMWLLSEKRSVAQNDQLVSWQEINQHQFWWSNNHLSSKNNKHYLVPDIQIWGSACFFNLFYVTMNWISLGLRKLWKC